MGVASPISSQGYYAQANGEDGPVRLYIFEPGLQLLIKNHPLIFFFFFSGIFCHLTRRFFTLYQ